MAFVRATARWFVTVGVVLLTGLATATNGCDDSDAPELERCTSFLGNPTYEWSFLPPVLISLVVGAIVFALLERLRRFWRHQRVLLEGAAT